MHFPHRKNMHRFSQLAKGQIRPDAHKAHEPQEVHLTGVACMYIATKFEEVHPLKLRTVHEKIGHRKLSTESILAKESEILEALGFALTGANHHEILTQLICTYGLTQS